MGPHFTVGHCLLHVACLLHIHNQIMTNATVTCTNAHLVYVPQLARGPLWHAHTRELPDDHAAMSVESLGL